MKIQPISGFKITDGRIFTLEADAIKAEGVYQIEALLNECIRWNDQELEVDQVVARSEELRTALEAAVS